MQRTPRSLPREITFVVLGLAASLIAIYSGLILIYAWVVEDNIFNRMVADEARRIETRYLTQGVVETPQSNFMTLHPEWRDMPSSVRSAYELDPSRIEHTLDNERTVHIKVMHLGDTDYVLVADVAAYEVSRDFLPALLRWLALLGVAFAIAVAGVAYLLARRITHPVNRLARDIEHLDSLIVGDGFSMNYPDNELRTLARAIEQSFSNLQNALDREKQFTRDVSHEMRTPLTILGTTLEASQGSSPLQGQPLERVRRASHDLKQLTETLLALARAESAEREQIDLKICIEDAVLQHFELNQSPRGQQLDLSLELDSGVMVRANAQLLNILLNNLISNVVRYATQPEVSIKLTADRMEFTNHSSRPAPFNPEQSGVKSDDSEGIGQGLSLISRICEANNWIVSYAHDGEIFSVVITLSTFNTDTGSAAP